MSEEMIYSFIVHDISITMDENSLKTDLMSRYDGVAKVTRMFYDGEDETPKTSVQVDFTSPTDAGRIRRDNNIVIGGICRRVYEINKPGYQQPNQRSRQNWQNTTKPLCEQDLINIFEEQKKLLTEVLNSFEGKLNNAIGIPQDKTAQPVLSSNT